MKETEALRKEFKDNGFSYSDIGSKEIGTLAKILKEELSNFDNNGFQMTLCKLRKEDIEYKENGLKKAVRFKEFKKWNLILVGEANLEDFEKAREEAWKEEKKRLGL